MILETSAKKGDYGKIFYGINKKGSNVFNSLEQKTYFLKKNSIFNERAEPQIDFIRINSNLTEYSGVEYLINFEKNYTHIFLYENPQKNYQIAYTNKMLASGDIEIYVWTSFNIIEDNIYYLIIGYIKKYNDNNYHFEIGKLYYFSNNGNINVRKVKNNNSIIS